MCYGRDVYDWNDIRIFLAVASEGSTLAASRKLNVNQTTVSRRIQALETALGLTLFDRDTRGYSLTAQGSALIDVAGHMAAAAENLSLRAGHLTRMTEGRIRVTAAHSVMNHWVLPLVAGFRRENPDIHFEVSAAEHNLSLENGDADIAFRAADRITGDSLITRKLSDVPWGVYCSKAYLAARGIPQSPEDLAQHSYLAYPPDLTRNAGAIAWMAEHVDPAREISTVESIVTMAALLRTENAIGVLPCVEGDAIPDLVPCFRHHRLKSTIWLVASRDSYQQPRVRKFMKYAAANFRIEAEPGANRPG